MKLQDLPKTAAETTVNLVRLPVELVTKVRDVVEKQFGGDNGAEVKEPAVEPTKAKAAKPKATPKKPAAKKPAAKKPAAKKAGASKAKAAKKPAPPSAASAPTPTATVPTAERPEVIAEQTDGLDDAVDRAQFELHRRDVDVNTGEQR